MIHESSFILGFISGAGYGAIIGIIAHIAARKYIGRINRK